MKRALVSGLAVFWAACGSSSPAVPDASTPDAGADVAIDAAPDAPATFPYPAGPYGGAVGETMPNFDIMGYPLSRTQRDYTQVPFRPISLAEVRSDPACTCMVVIWTASNCPWGLMEDTTFSSAMVDDPGLCAAEVIAFNIDSGADGFGGVPSPTRADLDDWVSANRQSYPVGLATTNTLTALSIGVLPEEPINFVVRTSDMRVVGIMDGVASNLGTQARALCNAPHPGIETLANGLAPTALQIDDVDAYVRDDVSGLFRVPLSGGTPQVMVDPARSPGVFALDATNVYFGAGSSGAYTLEQLPKSGGSPIVLESGSSSYDGVAVDSSFVYAARSDGAIERIPIGGGSATVLLSGELHPASLGVDDQNLYFISQDTHELAFVPKSGGQRVSEIPPGGYVFPVGQLFFPASLVVGQGELFVSGPQPVTGSWFYIPGATQGTFGELKLGQITSGLSGPNPTIAMSPQGLIMGFSCTGVAPCDDYPRGAIGTRSATNLWNTASPGEPFTNALAGDATTIYWTTAETSPGKHDGALRRLPR